MFLKHLTLSLCVVSAAYALPTIVRSTYALKERHIVPRGWAEVGPASKSQGIHLQIGLKQRNEGVIEQHLTEISDPSHVRYGQHLSAAEIREIVSPSIESIKLVHDWLLQHEITDAVYSPNTDWVSVLIPVEKAERLLQTSYKTFVHDEDGSTLLRAPEWSLPVHLHDHIDIVQPTNSFFRISKPKKVWPEEKNESESVDLLEDIEMGKRAVSRSQSHSNLTRTTLTDFGWLGQQRSNL